jgi:hypothetical protein
MVLQQKRSSCYCSQALAGVRVRTEGRCVCTFLVKSGEVDWLLHFLVNLLASPYTQLYHYEQGLPNLLSLFLCGLPIKLYYH